METKLCRICGKYTDKHVNIFKTDGLKNKLETCLPITVTQHCLLPDTICSECTKKVENFYTFVKDCLQSIIILEAQYDMNESCLKSKRRSEKGTCTEISTPLQKERAMQTDEVSFLKLYSEINFQKTFEEAERMLADKDYIGCTQTSKVNLVNYEITDGSSSETEECERTDTVALSGGGQTNELKNVNLSNFLVNKQYFDNQENKLINRIAQRISLKRKNDEILPHKTKMCKFDISSRRKSRQPKKIELRSIENVNSYNQWNANNSDLDNERNCEESPGDIETSEFLPQTNVTTTIPQVCLLCDAQFNSASLLAAHVFETHGIDMVQVLSSEPVLEKKKKLPNLVKITDLKTRTEQDSTQTIDAIEEPPPAQQSSFTCPLCPTVLTNHTDLYTHLRIKHPNESSLICGLCLQVLSSYSSLTMHLESCMQQRPIVSKYICKICYYNDDNPKLIENHVIVHDFLLLFCKKQAKIFDPCDYVEINDKCDATPKIYTCTECNLSNFEDFKEFSTHRRSQHQIFHCDLCNKFYGRNSHLWKHVNRLHKGHPSITCQLCYKTSASKYHLAQHFSKIHSAKLFNLKHEPPQDDFMTKKFQGFDFQSVKQSFMRQDMLQKEQKESVNEASDPDDESNGENVIKRENFAAGNHQKPADCDPKDLSLPKEIDASSNLYTNIITNYTPPENNGEFKCPKCLKGFHKKNLLKKHKKNCRPRLQKDLLTRCKTCSRIFKDRQSLTKHLINYHSEYVCEICSQKFQSKCEIVSHIRFTHPNCHLFCSCGNILRNNSDLLEHKSDHRNSFVCQFCGDNLPTKIKLKMHILSLHRKILSLSCGICLRLFETQHILKDHVRLVHKEHLLPLTSCTVCGKNYGSKWKTYDHLNKSHGRIFKPCKACLDVFDSEEELMAHYEAVHPKFIPHKIVTNLTAPIKKEEYASDFEQNSYDNEEKNTNTDISNDADVYVPYQLKTTQSDYEEANHEEKLNFVNMADENKISLLEKRLLGKKLTEDIQKKQVKKAKAQKKMKKHDVKRDFDENEIHSHNSSKRTVYVNSNDPSVCEICFKMWPAKKHLWQHYIRCHKTVAATVCGICLKAIGNYEALQKHLHEIHPTLLHGRGFGSNFICRICGRYHNASSKLKLHMAIHENFDWLILESFQSKANVQTVKDEPANNGIMLDIKKENMANEINYESLIEQVECSSESDESEEEKLQDFDESQANNEDSSSSDESDNESEVSGENSLESQMLQNMLREKGILQQNNVKSEGGGYNNSYEAQNKQDIASSDSEETTNSSSEQDDYKVEIKSENCTTDEEDEDDDSHELMNDQDSCASDDSAQNIFNRKPEELDSAIKSISYEHVGNIDVTMDEQFCEIQSQNLNPYEIQTAVDSIL